MQTRIPCVLMRGGTSRGPFFLASDLPADAAMRDAVLLSVMGSPHEIQVDGIGGAHSVTSKVAIISKSKHHLDADFTAGKPVIRRAALIRTARRIFDGHVHVPENVWSGADKRPVQAAARARAPAKAA